MVKGRWENWLDWLGVAFIILGLIFLYVALIGF